MENTKQDNGLFDALYNVSEEEVKASKKPFVRNKTIRNFDSAIDSLLQCKIDLDESIGQYQRNIANGNGEQIRALLDAEIRKDEIDRQVSKLERIKASFFPKD